MIEFSNLAFTNATNIFHDLSHMPPEGVAGRVVSSCPRFLIFGCEKFRYCALSLLKIQSKLSLTGQCLKTSAPKRGVAATWLPAIQTRFWVEEVHSDTIYPAKKEQLWLTKYHSGVGLPEGEST